MIIAHHNYGIATLRVAGVLSQLREKIRQQRLNASSTGKFHFSTSYIPVLAVCHIYQSWLFVTYTSPGCLSYIPVLAVCHIYQSWLFVIYTSPGCLSHIPVLAVCHIYQSWLFVTYTSPGCLSLWLSVSFVCIYG